MQEYLLNLSQQIVPWLMTHGVKIIFILVGAYILHKIARKFIIKMIQVAVGAKSSISAEDERKREDTLIQIFVLTLKIVLLTVTTLMVLHEIGIMIGPILAAAGIVGLAIGFGGQYLIRDIITGLFIIIENQYRVGDVVSFDTASGTVEAISLRKTTLRDLDGTVHHIPHGEIKKVSNYTQDFSRIKLDLGVAYNTNVEHVKRVINETGEEMINDPLWQPVILKAPQFKRIEEFTDSSIVIRIIGETMPHSKWDVVGEFRKRIKEAFEKENIEIPFPQSVVHHIHQGGTDGNAEPKSLDEQATD